MLNIDKQIEKILRLYFKGYAYWEALRIAKSEVIGDESNNNELYE